VSRMVLSPAGIPTSKYILMFLATPDVTFVT
jgi:hypothetical protein